MNRSDSSAAERALRLHREAIVVDAHADTPTEFFLEPDYDFGRRHAEGHVDLPRLREGGVALQFLIAWVPAELAATPGASFAHAMRLVEAIHAVVGRTEGVRLLTEVAEVARAREAGEIGVMLGVEGGHAIENSLERLRELHARGARYMTLTWNNGNDWADSSAEPPRHGGLTPFGREVIREMNRLRMLVDVSHVSERTFYDVLEVSSMPVAATHSCARTLADHHRNLADEQLRALASAGGVVGVNFFPTFLDARYGTAFEAIEREAHEREARLREQLGDPTRARTQARAWRNSEFERLPPVPYSAVADHIDHIAHVAGIDHVALGSDFDGISTTPAGLPDVAHLPRLTELLVRRGYAERDIHKILGGNLLALLGRVIG
jgi:membrane dipeptidase